MVTAATVPYGKDPCRTRNRTTASRTSYGTVTAKHYGHDTGGESQFRCILGTA
ncbi:hypothetical protein BDZ89DRAFT_1068450 [Hymenopellis radicata]|nr:hypothetical protein BDZ89DRAFT_1068450 [Hymenopellis radicata]